jgi:predicted nucleotidyltransferase
MIVLTKQQLEAIRALCSEFQVQKLELFGSATRDDFDPEHSDIDMLVEFTPQADLGPWMARFFDLQAQLEAVLGRKVDLVMAKGLRNPYLIRAVDRDRRVLYAA